MKRTPYRAGLQAAWNVLVFGFLVMMGVQALGCGDLEGSSSTASDTATGTGLAYSPVFLEHSLGASHPESPDRLRHIIDTLEATGLWGRLRPVAPHEEPLPHLAALHSQEHIEAIQAIETTGEVALAAVAHVLGAVKDVSEGKLGNAFCAVRPPGHHSHDYGREEGFCFYNNVAVAAKYAQSLGHKRILIVDWDYHHGDGTEAFFYRDPDVLFFSTHDTFSYPGTGAPGRRGEGPGEGLSINVHLDCGAGDEDILSAFRDSLLPAAHAFRPDFVLISAGFDSRQQDLLGCFDITDKGFVSLTEMMLQIAETWSEGRLVSVLEGGYNLTGLASATAAHVRTLMEHNPVPLGRMGVGSGTR